MTPEEPRKMLCHDPRISNDRSVLVETDNPALISAKYGSMIFPHLEVDWETVAARADYCDAPANLTEDMAHAAVDMLRIFK